MYLYAEYLLGFLCMVKMMINERIIYNVQKQILEEVKQELLKKAETERQRNVIKETCRSVARRHKFEEMR